MLGAFSSLTDGTLLDFPIFDIASRHVILSLHLFRSNQEWSLLGKFASKREEKVQRQRKENQDQFEETASQNCSVLVFSVRWIYEH
jgi:hypothetical protein